MGMNRKGMISIMDAVIFISLISVVAAMLFAFPHSDEYNRPTAGEVTEQFLSVELKASDVLDTDDSKTYPISMLIAAEINSGDTDAAAKMVKDVFDRIVPSGHGYTVEMEYEGKKIMVDRQRECDVTSHCRTLVPVIKDRCLGISVEIR